MRVPAPSDRLLDRGFVLPILAAFAGFVGIGAIVPVLPVHLRTDLGGSDVELGLVVGTFSITALLSRIAAGRLVDRRGGVAGLILGLLVCAAGGALFLAPLGVPGLFLARGVQGAGNAFLFASSADLVVAATPLDQRARALGLLGIGTWGGLAVGPLAGAILGSYAATAWFVVLLPLPVLLAVVRWLPPVARVPPPPHAVVARTFPREAVIPGVALGLNAVSTVTLTGFLVLRMAEVGGGGALAYGAFASSVVVTRLLLGGLVDRAPARTTMLLGSLCCGAGLFMVALAPLPAVGVLGAILTGVGFGFPWLALATWTLGRVGEHEKGGAIGVLTLLSDAAMFAGATAAGAIAGSFGYAATFWFAGIAVLLAAAVVLPQLRAHPNRARPASALAGPAPIDS